MSIIFIWKTGSTASTLTPVPLWGIANTSTTRTVKSSTNSPSIRPMTSMGTPARPWRSILRRAREDMCTVSELSMRFVLSCAPCIVSTPSPQAVPRPRFQPEKLLTVPGAAPRPMLAPPPPKRDRILLSMISDTAAGRRGRNRQGRRLDGARLGQAECDTRLSPGRRSRCCLRLVFTCRRQRSGAIQRGIDT